jgi:3-oxoacyl-[acyl-carrier protein] reductase
MSQRHVKGKPANVVVTGGSRGLGLGIAECLAGSGFHAIAVARREGDRLPAVRERVAASGIGALHFRAFDLADIASIGGFVKNLRAEFGPIHGLVNNAAAGDASVLSNMPNATIERMLRLNVLSPMTLTKYVVRSMMTGRGGRIVNVSSVVATTGYSGLSVYSATKASLLGFTKSLARELGPLGITVNAVAPGFIDTEMTHDMNPEARAKVARRSALGRMPEIIDVANAVDFLFSEKARNITGTVMTVDAGNTA